MKEKYKLIAKKLELSKGEIQSYYLDENPKANIAEYRKKEKKICVNKKFEEVLRGKPNELARVLGEHVVHTKGEFVVVLAPC